MSEATEDGSDDVIASVYKSWTVAQALTKAMLWAKVPHAFYVHDWIRIAKVNGPVDFNTETEILNQLNITLQRKKKDETK